MNSCLFRWIKQLWLGSNRIEIVQPVLHNLKGIGSRLISMMGRVLPKDDAFALLCKVIWIVGTSFCSSLYA